MLWAPKEQFLEQQRGGKVAPLRLGLRDFLWLTLAHHPEKEV